MYFASLDEAFPIIQFDRNKYQEPTITPIPEPVQIVTEPLLVPQQREYTFCDSFENHINQCSYCKMKYGSNDNVILLFLLLIFVWFLGSWQKK